MNVYQQLNHSMHAKTWEPRRRNKDGLQWINHRFPIKGGISFHEVLLEDMKGRNALVGNALLKIIKVSPDA